MRSSGAGNEPGKSVSWKEEEEGEKRRRTMPFRGQFVAVGPVDVLESREDGIDSFKIENGSLCVVNVCNEATIEVFSNHCKESLSGSSERIEVSSNCETRFRSEYDVRCFRVHKP